MSDVQRVTVDLWPDAGQALGLSRSGTYAAAKKGQIPTVRFGRLKKVPAWFLAQHRDGPVQQHGADAAD
jgi:hypothetical protein